MGTLAEYFDKNRPTATWQFGDRVYGNFEGVPFVGTCGGEGMVNETEGTLVTVFLDLPLKSKNKWHTTFIKVKPKTLKRLPSSDDPVKKSK
jgi:hypothetical protein